MSHAVLARDVTKSFGSVAALRGASWHADGGEVTAVLGPNGAGKTTMIESLEGLIRPDGGQVRVLGTDPWRAGAGHRARVGVMLQDGGLPGGVRPVPLLRHLAAMYAEPERVDDLVGALGIDGFPRASIRRLSGGQRQRVALAAALVGRPAVVFLDEPTSGLDPHARLAVWELVGAVARRGTAVVVTTHSFEEAERLADRVVIVEAGRVVAEGTPEDLTREVTLEELYFSLTRRAAS